MGKLLEKLRQVGQGGGGSFGFFGRSQSAAQPARPAAIVVRIAPTDAAAAEAAAKAGADMVLISEWKRGADISAVKAALESGGVLWGVEYSGGADDEVVKEAQQAGAGFLTLGERASVAPLYDKPDQFDRVITLTAPTTELDFLYFRMASALPARAGIVALPISVAKLPNLTVAEFTRLAPLAATVRFPVLVAVDETPSLQATRALIHLGFDGIVLAATGAEKIGKQVQALRADLETIPLDEAQDRDGVSLGGLMGNLGASATPERPEPDKEPEHE